jgi:WD40 repeat protein
MDSSLRRAFVFALSTSVAACGQGDPGGGGSRQEPPSLGGPSAALPADSSPPTVADASVGHASSADASATDASSLPPADGSFVPDDAAPAADGAWGSDATAADAGAPAGNAPPFARCGALGFGSANSVAVSPNGSLVAVGSSLDEVLVFSNTDGTIAARLATSGGVNSVAFSLDGSHLAAAEQNGNVDIWRVASWALERTVSHVEGGGQVALSVAFSPDGLLLASVGPTLAVVWRISDGTAIRKLVTAVDDSADLCAGAAAFSPKGDLLAAGATVFRVADGSVALRLAPLQGVTAVAFSADGSRLAAIGDNHLSVSEWRLRDGARIASRTVPYSVTGTDFFTAIAFRPGAGDLLVANESRIELWGVLDARAPLPQPLGAVATSPVTGTEQMQFSSDGSTLAIVDGPSIALLDGASPSLFSDRPQRTIDSSVDAELVLAFSPDGRALVTGGSPDSVLVWDTGSQNVSYRLDVAGAAAYSPDGSTLATASSVSVIPGIVLRRASDGVPLRTIGQDVYGITALAFAPDGHEVAAATNDGTIVRLRVADGQRIAMLSSMGRLSQSLLYSPDGFQLASVSRYRGGDVLRLSDGAELLSLSANPAVFGFSYSADGSRAATVLHDAQGLDSLSLLRTSDWSVIVQLAPGGLPRALAIDPWTGMIALATVLQARLLRDDGTVVQTFPTLSELGVNWSLAFSSDGRRLAIWDPSRIVRMYCR